MKANFKNIFLLLSFLLVAVIFAYIVVNMFDEQETFRYSDLIEQFDNKQVVSFEVNEKFEITVYSKIIDEANSTDGNLVFVTENGKYVLEQHVYRLSHSFQLEEINKIAEEQYKAGIIEYYDYKAAQDAPWYVAYLPYIILGAILVGLWIYMLKQTSMGAGKINSFAKAKAKMNGADKNAVKFADVAGADEEKAELEEVVEFLKNPAKFVRLGARIPRGVLLVGPPGTGKTLLAKAVAGEAGVPFFSISGSDFVEMYVGVGASRVRDLFEQARKSPASIIFIDEIDAVGRHRGAGLGGGHDEREQTLNQLLVEMDGFGNQEGVIVIAATNRPDILDPALLRPGRFDRQVTVNYPDIKGREEILKVHCRNKPLEETVDLKKIAQITIGFTGADLANLLNEAALRAAKKNKQLIGMDDIEESYMKILLGPQKKNKVRTEKDNVLCAYHEAGHAVASYYCKYTDPVKQITIIPAGNAGGVTLSVPTEDRMSDTKNEMLDQIVRALGGRAAEELILEDISTGASSDIQQATKIARNMVTRYGMSEKLGTVLYGSEHSQDEVFLGRDFSTGKNYSEKTAAEIDDEIRSIISQSYDRCKKYLSDHIEKLHFVAKFLLKNETMDQDQFNYAMENDDPTIEDIEKIAEEKKRKSEEENRMRAERQREEAERMARAMNDEFMRNFNPDPGYTGGSSNDRSDNGGASDGHGDIGGDAVDPADHTGDDGTNNDNVGNDNSDPDKK